MEIFDFHLHPGYDFHENDTDPHNFVKRLVKNKITGAAGNFINMAINKQPLEDYPELITNANQKAWEFNKMYPEFFVPGIHIHPEFLNLSCEQLEMHSKKGFNLIGELVGYMMGFDFNHKNWNEILTLAGEKEMVLSFHTPKRDFDAFENLARQFKNVKFVIAHLDGYGLYDRCISIMSECDNVYADLSAYGADREGMLKDAVSKVGSHKILFGTDYPGSNDNTWTHKFVNYVLNEDITDTDRENIMYKNAKTLLNVK